MRTISIPSLSDFAPGPPLAGGTAGQGHKKRPPVGSAGPKGDWWEGATLPVTAAVYHIPRPAPTPFVQKATSFLTVFFRPPLSLSYRRSAVFFVHLPRIPPQRVHCLLPATAEGRPDDKSPSPPSRNHPWPATKGSVPPTRGGRRTAGATGESPLSAPPGSPVEKRLLPPYLPTTKQGSAEERRLAPKSCHRKRETRWPKPQPAFAQPLLTC